MTAVRQIERLGFKPCDVRNIVMSHLDFDHAGGMDDFPHATVHMMATEREPALKGASWLDRQRFRTEQWSSQSAWGVYDCNGGDSWQGFECVRPLDGLMSQDIALIPLRGHTYSHAGIAVRGDRGWLFHAADAYFDRDEIDWADPRCAPGLRLYQWMMKKDHAARLENQRRLRGLCRRVPEGLTVFCSHDVREFESLSGRSAQVPLEHTARALKSRR
jgi:glyoxylase-like metal-dependent hydrolase (beta-lactamase superfamily II)